MKKYIQINPADNVIVAIDPLSAGDNITVGTTTITVSEDIPAGHKVALQNSELAILLSSMVSRSDMPGMISP